jgi:hypothetical protein
VIRNPSPSVHPSGCCRAATIAKRGGIAAGIAGAIGAVAALFTLRGSSRKGEPKDSDS